MQAEMLFYISYEDVLEKVILLWDVLFNWVAVCIRASTRSTTWDYFSVANGRDCLFEALVSCSIIVYCDHDLCSWISRNPITLDGNLNLYDIWQNNAVNFLQISVKRQHLIVVLALVILYCFETACLIIFFIFDICKFQDHWFIFEDMTKLMKGKYILLEPLYLCCK